MGEPAVSGWFEALLQRYHQPLIVFVRGALGDAQQACDITQEVFVAAWRAAEARMPPFTPPSAEQGVDEQGIRRWLYRVAYHRTISYLRHHRLIAWESLERIAEPESETYHAPVAFEDQVVEGEVLRAALRRLSATDAACVLLAVVQGFTASEVAQIIETTPEAAKKRLWRAKERLRAAYFAQDAARAARELVGEEDA